MNLASEKGANIMAQRSAIEVRVELKSQNELLQRIERTTRELAAEPGENSFELTKAARDKESTVARITLLEAELRLAAD